MWAAFNNKSFPFRHNLKGKKNEMHHISIRYDKGLVIIKQIAYTHYNWYVEDFTKVKSIQE
jgi:hypothetical protein